MLEEEALKRKGEGGAKARAIDNDVHIFAHHMIKDQGRSRDKAAEMLNTNKTYLVRTKYLNRCLT